MVARWKWKAAAGEEQQDGGEGGSGEGGEGCEERVREKKPGVK